ncbi:MAG: zf-HC2 domain-containing protein [Ignavibacteria bacterium]|nr:zf-HC2 domain-containing protein [Ignavibacteria bacterium]
MNAAHHTEVLIQEYLDGRMTTEEKERFELHLSSCSRCRSEVTALRKIDSALSRLPLETPGKHFTPALMQKLLTASPSASFRVLEYAAYMFGFLIVVTLTISALVFAGVMNTADVSPSSVTTEITGHLKTTVTSVLVWLRGVLPFAVNGPGGKLALVGALSVALIALVDRFFTRWTGHRS